MKKIAFSTVLVCITLISMSFISPSINTIYLVGTKWISPLNDNCFDSLCFTSEKNVMYYTCKDSWYWEVGYEITDDIVEVRVFDSVGTQMILKVDNGILREIPNQNNTQPRNFIKITRSDCD